MDNADIQEESVAPAFSVVRCDCGTEVKIDRGAVSFYCPTCEAAKMVGAGLGFILPKE